MNHQSLAQVLERLKRVLLVDNCQFRLHALGDAVKNVNEGVAERVEHLVVVLVEGHLQIQADKLGEVAVRLRVFGAED